MTENLPVIHKDMTLREIQVEAHRNSVAHEFWESENFGEKIALIHSELSEALEARLAGEAEAEILVEIADAQIRTADLAEHRGIDLTARCSEISLRLDDQDGFTAILARTHRVYSMALEEHRDREPDPWEIGHQLALGWLHLEALAQRCFDGDLSQIRAAKMIKNRGRKKRHGKRY